MIAGEYSEDYLQWVGSPEYKKFFGENELTNGQHRFAEFLFQNKDMIRSIGNMDPVFGSIRQYLKHQS